MKKLFLALAICSAATFVSAKPYVDAQVGMSAASGSQAALYGFRVGSIFGQGEYSLGYFSARNMKAAEIASDGLDLHVVDVEGYRRFDLAPTWTGKLGGGIGYVVPDLHSGADETADTSSAWILGAGLQKDLNADCAVGVDLKVLVSKMHTHVTTYNVHEETLSNAQVVEIRDEEHHDDSVSLNSVLFSIALRWK